MTKRRIVVITGLFLGLALMWFLSPLLESKTLHSSHQTGITAGQPTVVDFYGEHCGFCQRVEPVIQAMRREYAGKVTFYRVDRENPAEDAVYSFYAIDGTPTYLIFDAKGRYVGQSHNPVAVNEGLKRLL